MLAKSNLDGNIHEMLIDLEARFRFRAALHHKVANGKASIKGLKKLDSLVREYQISSTVLVQAASLNEQACSMLADDRIPIYVDDLMTWLWFLMLRMIFDVLGKYELGLTHLTPKSIKFIIGFALLCSRLQMLARSVVFQSFFQC